MDKIITCLTGPSLSGKSTITNILIRNHDIVLPQHITTRDPRTDDIKGFYKYISLDEFRNKLNNGEFIVGSTDGIRGYGVLLEDCNIAFKNSDTLLLHVSYKDIAQLKMIEVPIRLVVLTYSDLERSMKERFFIANKSRSDIDYRILSAKKDYDTYFDEIKEFATNIVYTDLNNVDDTYKIVSESFGFKPYVRKRVK